MDPIPKYGRLALLGVDRDGTVHLLHLLLSVSVIIYSMSRWLFACLGGFPTKGLPLVVKIHVELF